MDSWIVGRSNDCDIVVTFPTVSRRHAKLTGVGPEIEVRDIGSSTGTFVIQDGEWSQVMHTKVSCDEPIRLGDHKTTVRALLATAGIEIQGGGKGIIEDIATQPRRD